MDPNFSVLLGGEKKDTCPGNEEEEEKGKQGKTYKLDSALVGGLVGGVVGVIIIIAAFIFIIYPKLKLWMANSSAKSAVPLKENKRRSKRGSKNKDKWEEEDEMEIERRGDMDLNTVSGRYVLRF